MLKRLVRRQPTLLVTIALVAAGVVQAQDLGSTTGVLRRAKPVPRSAAKKSKPPATPVSNTRNTSAEPSRNAARSSSPSPERETAKVKSAPASPQPAASTKSSPEAMFLKVFGPEASRAARGLSVSRDGLGADELYEIALGQGNSARDGRDYARAEEEYRRAYSLKADSRAAYGLGNVYSDQQRWEEAEFAYRKSIELDPKAPEAYVALSFVLIQPIPAPNLAGRYEEAERLARRALELEPLTAFGHDQLGAALEMRGIISQETRSAYERAIRLEPEFALAYAHLGRLHGRNGLLKESEESYGKAVTYTTDVPTMILVAEVMQSQQRFAESEALLRRALSGDPKNPTALLMLGHALTTRAVYEEAESFLQKAVAVSPKSFVAHSLLGSLYLRQSKNVQAERSLLKAAQFASVYEKMRLALDFEALADSYRQASRFADAARALKQAVILDPSRKNITRKT